MSADEADHFEEISLADGDLFHIQDDSERVHAFRDVLVPKLKKLLDFGLGMIPDSDRQGIRTRHAIVRRPSFRSTTRNPRDFGNVYVGLGPKLASQGTLFRKPDGDLAKYGYFNLVFELSKDELCPKVRASRPHEASVLLELMRKHKDAVVLYGGSPHWLQLFSGNQGKEDLSLDEQIDEIEIQEDAQWFNLELASFPIPLPITFEDRNHCAINFVTLLPFYLAMSDWYFGEKDRLPEYLDKYWASLGSMPSGGADEVAEEENHSGVELIETDDADTGEPDPSPPESLAGAGVESGDGPGPFQAEADAESTSISGPGRASRDAADQQLGQDGELFVLASERDRLRRASRPDLADRVRHVSVEDGDGAGYDILSFDDSGEPLHIEVKTTRGDDRTPFEITANELRFAEAHPETYQLHRVFDFDARRAVFVLTPPLARSCTITPTRFRVGFETQPGP